MNLNKQEHETLWFKLSEPWNMQVYVCVCVCVCVCARACVLLYIYIYSSTHYSVTANIAYDFCNTGSFKIKPQLIQPQGCPPHLPVEHLGALGARLSLRTDGQSSALCYNPKQFSAIY